MKSALLLLSTLAVTTSLALQPCPSSKVPMLNTILHDLDIQFPDTYFHNASLQANLTGVHLDGICVGDVTAEFREKDNLLLVNVNHVGLVVSGNYSIRDDLFKLVTIKQHGGLTATIEGSSMNFGLAVQTDTSGVPRSALVAHGKAGCSTDIVRHVKLKFSPEKAILEEFAHIFTTLFGGIINDALCSAIRVGVPALTNPALRKLNDVVQPYLKPVPPPVAPKMKFDPNLIDWKTNKLATTVSDMFNLYPTVMKQVIRRFANEQGYLHVDLSALDMLTFQMNITDLINVRVQVLSAGAKNLDKVDQFVPISAGSTNPSYELWSTIEGQSGSPIMMQLEAKVELFHATSSTTNKHPTEHVAASWLGKPTPSNEQPFVTFKPVLDLKLEDLHVWQKTLLPLRQAAVERISVDQITQQGCLSEVVDDRVEVYDAGFHLGWSPDTMSVHGIDGEVLDSFVHEVIRATNSLLQPFISVVLGNLVAEQVPKLANEEIHTKLINHTASCTSEPHGVDLIDFRNSSLVQTVSKFLNHGVLPKLDQYVDKLLPSGSVDFPKTLINESVKGVNVSVSNMHVSGLDTFYNMAFMVPSKTDPYRLHHSFGIGSSKMPHHDFDVELEVTVEADLKYQGQDLKHNDVVVGLSVSNLSVELDTIAKVDRNEMKDWKLGDFLQLKYNNPCLLAAVHTFDVANLNITVGSVGVDIHCVSCTAEDLQRISEAFDKPMAKRMITRYLTKRLTGVLPDIDVNLQGTINQMTNHFIGESYKLCHHPERTYAPTKSHHPHHSVGSGGFGLGAIVGLSAGCVAVVSVVLVCLLTPGKPAISRDHVQHDGTEYHVLSDDGGDAAGGAVEDASIEEP